MTAAVYSASRRILILIKRVLGSFRFDHAVFRWCSYNCAYHRAGMCKRFEVVKHMGGVVAQVNWAQRRRPRQHETVLPLLYNRGPKTCFYHFLPGKEFRSICEKYEIFLGLYLHKRGRTVSVASAQHERVSSHHVPRANAGFTHSTRILIRQCQCKASINFLAGVS